MQRRMSHTVFCMQYIIVLNLLAVKRLVDLLDSKQSYLAWRRFEGIPKLQYPLARQFRTDERLLREITGDQEQL